MAKNTDDKKTGFSFINVTDNSTKHGGSAVYGLGFIGAFIYYVQASDNFWMIIVGLFKAIVWPAIIVFKLLEGYYG